MATGAPAKPTAAPDRRDFKTRPAAGPTSAHSPPTSSAAPPKPGQTDAGAGPREPLQPEPAGAPATTACNKNLTARQLAAGESSDSAISSSPSSARLSTASSGSSCPSSASSCAEDELVGREETLSRSPSPRPAAFTDEQPAAEPANNSEPHEGTRPRRDLRAGTGDASGETARKRSAHAAAPQPTLDCPASQQQDNVRDLPSGSRHVPNSSHLARHNAAYADYHAQFAPPAVHYYSYATTGAPVPIPSQQVFNPQQQQHHHHYHHQQQQQLQQQQQQHQHQQQQQQQQQYALPTAFYQHTTPAIYTGPPLALASRANHEQQQDPHLDKQAQAASTTAPSAPTYHVYPGQYPAGPAAGVLPHYASAAPIQPVYYYQHPTTTFSLPVAASAPVPLVSPPVSCYWPPGTDSGYTTRPMAPHECVGQHNSKYQLDYQTPDSRCYCASCRETSSSNDIRAAQAQEHCCCCWDEPGAGAARGTEVELDDEDDVDDDSDTALPDTRSPSRGDELNPSAGGHIVEKDSDCTGTEAKSSHNRLDNENESRQTYSRRQQAADNQASEARAASAQAHSVSHSKAQKVHHNHSHDSNQRPYYHYYYCSPGQHQPSPAVSQAAPQLLAGPQSHHAMVGPPPVVSAAVAAGAAFPTCPVFWQSTVPQFGYCYTNRWMPYQQPFLNTNYYCTSNKTNVAEHLGGALYAQQSPKMSTTAEGALQDLGLLNEPQLRFKFLESVEQFVCQLPIEMEPTRTRQAYGMDKVWQEEFELLFSQFSQISDIIWHLVEVETNPNIVDSSRIMGYKSRYLVLMEPREPNVVESLVDDGGEGDDDKASESADSSEASSVVEHGLISNNQTADRQLEVSNSDSDCDSGTVVNAADSQASTDDTTDKDEPPPSRVVEQVDAAEARSSAADRKFPIRFKMFIDSAKVRFCCDKCGHGWTSMKGRVVFWYELFELLDHHQTGMGGFASVEQPCGNTVVGYCAYKLFGQQCDLCKVEGRFERPMWYPEEVTKVLNNLYNKIGQLYFGFRMPTIDKQRRAGKPKTAHNSSLCQACHDGVCTDRK